MKIRTMCISLTATVEQLIRLTILITTYTLSNLTGSGTADGMLNQLVGFVGENLDPIYSSYEGEYAPMSLSIEGSVQDRLTPWID